MHQLTKYSLIDTIRVDLRDLRGFTMGLTKAEKAQQNEEKQIKKLAKKAKKAEAKLAKQEKKAADKALKAEKKAILAEEKREKNRQKFMHDYFSKKMDGAIDFDHLIQKDYDQALIRAKHVLGLSDQDVNEYSPIIVSLPEIFYPGSKLKIKMGKKNDHLRYNQSRVSILLFGEKQLYYYTALVDHIQSAISDDYTVEIPYQAIVSVETKSVRLFDTKSYHHFIDYQLFLVNDHGITIRFKDIVKAEKDLQKGVSIPEATQQTLNGLSRFLREKRGL
jgi:hypothetical protein